LELSFLFLGSWFPITIIATIGGIIISIVTGKHVLPGLPWTIFQTLALLQVCTWDQWDVLGGTEMGMLY